MSDTDNPLAKSGGGISGSPQAQSGSDQAAAIKDDLSKVAHRAARDLDEVKQEAKAQLEDVREQAQEQMEKATEKAKGFAGEQKDLAADQLEGVATALAKVAGELQGEHGTISGYADTLAGTIRDAANSLRRNSVDEVVRNLNDFGQRQPAAFLGAALLAGFAASRFMLSSSPRQRQTTGMGSGQQPASDSYADDSGHAVPDPAPLGSGSSTYSSTTIGGH